MDKINNPSGGGLPPEGALGYWIIGEGDSEEPMNRIRGVFSRRNWRELRENGVGDEDLVIFQSGFRVWPIQQGFMDAWTGILVMQQAYLQGVGNAYDVPRELVLKWRRESPDATISTDEDGVIIADYVIEEEE